MELSNWLANKKMLAGWWVIQMELPDLLVTKKGKPNLWVIMWSVRIIWYSRWVNWIFKFWKDYVN